MKKLLLLVAAMCCMSTSICAEPFDLTFEVIGKGSNVHPLPKSPIDPPQAVLDGNVLTFESSHPAYALTLFDEEDEVAYQVTVPANVSVVYLPATLSGTYVLTLDFGGSYYFWSEIIL